MTDKVEQRKTEMVDAAESLGISQEEYDKIVDECIFGEKPISKELEKAAVEAFKKIVDSDKNNFLEIFKAGAEWKKANLWKDAQGDELPEYDKEVIVFTQDFPNDAGMMCVAIGHRPDPKGWDGKSLSTGKIEHYTPQCYGKGGWNLPNIKFWLDLDLPVEEGGSE